MDVVAIALLLMQKERRWLLNHHRKTIRQESSKLPRVLEQSLGSSESAFVRAKVRTLQVVWRCTKMITFFFCEDFLQWQKRDAISKDKSETRAVKRSREANVEYAEQESIAFCQMDSEQHQSLSLRELAVYNHLEASHKGWKQNDLKLISIGFNAHSP